MAFLMFFCIFIECSKYFKCFIPIPSALIPYHHPSIWIYCLPEATQRLLVKFAALKGKEGLKSGAWDGARAIVFADLCRVNEDLAKCSLCLECPMY